MPVGPPPIRPVFTHNSFMSLHPSYTISGGYRFISVLVSFPVLRYVACHVTICTCFDILERVLPSCSCFGSQNSSLTWLWLWSWLRYCDFPFSCTLSCKGESYISSQVVFIRMKWDKLIAKDAALVHLCLKRDILGQVLRTVWHVHTVTDVLSLRHS